MRRNLVAIPKREHPEQHIAHNMSTCSGALLGGSLPVRSVSKHGCPYYCVPFQVGLKGHKKENQYFAPWFDTRNYLAGV